MSFQELEETVSEMLQLKCRAVDIWYDGYGCKGTRLIHLFFIFDGAGLTHSACHSVTTQMNPLFEITFSHFISRSSFKTAAQYRTNVDSQCIRVK